MRVWVWLVVSQTLLIAADTRGRGSKTSGVNGGSVYFDSSSGEFKRSRPRPRMVGSAEIIKRTPIRTFPSGGTVSKVLKRRKKYRRGPARPNKLSEEKPKQSEQQQAFKKLPPLKTKYKTSDSIRMHLRRPEEVKLSGTNNLSARSHHNKVSSEKKNQKNQKNRINKINKIRAEPQKPLELSEKFKFKQAGRQPALQQAESREDRTYKYFDQPEEVLLTSGYHHQLSIQDPAYDYTIGDTRIRPGGSISQNPSSDMMMTQQFAPTPSSPPEYQSYPGLYFPPTESSEDENPLKNYDFALGGGQTGIAAVNPVLNYLSLSPPQPVGLPTSTARPAVPSTTTTTTSWRRPQSPTEASRRSHTTQRVPATGRRFPHFPSMEITENHIDDFLRSRSEKRMMTTTSRPGYYDYDDQPRHRTQFEELDNFANFRQDYSKMTEKRFPYRPQSYDNYQQRKSVTTLSPNSVDGVAQYKQTTTSSVPNNKNNFFVDWGMRVDHPELTIKREIPASTKPKIKIPLKTTMKAKPKASNGEAYQLRNFRNPISNHPGVYGEVQTTTRYSTDFNSSPQPANVYSYTPAPPVYTASPTPVYTPSPPPVYNPSPPVYNPSQPPVYTTTPPPVYTPKKSPVYTPKKPPVYTPKKAPVYTPKKAPVYTPKKPPVSSDNTQRSLNPRQGFKNTFYNSFHHLDPLKPYQPAITFLDKSVSAEQRSFTDHYQVPGPATATRDYQFPQTNLQDFPEQDNSHHFPPLGQNYQIFKPNEIQNSFGPFGKPKPSPQDDPGTMLKTNKDFSQTERFFQSGPSFTEFDVRNKNVWEKPAQRNEKRATQPVAVDQNRRQNNKNSNAGQFSEREPGGYYIKVFNNDGNNYSIKDGNFHQQSDKTIKDRSSKQTEGRGMVRKSRLPQYEKGPEWSTDEHWDNFESREISETFPFLF